MRYNLGVDPLANPNPDLTAPSNTGLLETIINGESLHQQLLEMQVQEPINTLEQYYTSCPPTHGTSGTETAPVKVITNDPCPANFRVPTTTEFQNLVNSTVQTNTNDTSWDNGSTTTMLQ